jgi:hypothetical protein
VVDADVDRRSARSEERRREREEHRAISPVGTGYGR